MKLEMLSADSVFVANNCVGHSGLYLVDDQRQVRRVTNINYRAVRAREVCPPEMFPPSSEVIEVVLPD